MKIFIFGNIASGKTTVSKFLSSAFPTFERICIDDFRKRYGDGTMEKEKIAKSFFIDAVIAGKNQIVEAMGTGDTGEALQRKAVHFSEPLLVVVLKTDLPVCKKRLAARVWDIPYPAPTSQAEKLAEAMNPFFVSGTLADVWKFISGCTVFETDCFDDGSFRRVLEIVRERLRYEAE